MASPSFDPKAGKRVGHMSGKGTRTEQIPLEDGTLKVVSVLSFRERHHLPQVVDALLADAPVAFHGWGVSGVCGRVDGASYFQKFWSLKQGRPPGSKIPLLEPPEEVVRHVDWQKVHPAYRYLRDPASLRRVWKGLAPFHLIFPYRVEGGTLSEAVVTPAFDPDVAPHTPVPTVCFFWIDDPALVRLVREVKALNRGVQLGVSSLNDPKQTPPFNTPDLLAYLKSRGIGRYDVVIEDPVVEPIGIASSHSQFVAPLEGEEPVWVMKRRGSFSAHGFTMRTGFPVIGAETAKVAARQADPERDLDAEVEECARRIRRWRLRETFHWF